MGTLSHVFRCLSFCCACAALASRIPRLDVGLRVVDTCFPIPDRYRCAAASPPRILRELVGCTFHLMPRAVPPPADHLTVLSLARTHPMPWQCPAQAPVLA